MHDPSHGEFKRRNLEAKLKDFATRLDRGSAQLTHHSTCTHALLQITHAISISTTTNNHHTVPPNPSLHPQRKQPQLIPPINLLPLLPPHLAPIQIPRMHLNSLIRRTREIGSQEESAPASQTSVSRATVTHSHSAPNQNKTPSPP